MGLLEDVMARRFWNDWERRFRRNHYKYIKPDEPEVVRTAESLTINENLSDIRIAEELWDFVRENHEYNLAKRWRKPEETLLEGEGDCEDYVFLIGSLLPNFGVNEFDVIAGEAFFNDGSEFHVWLEVGGDTIDPTAPKEKVPEIEYVPELSFHINIEQ